LEWAISIADSEHSGCLSRISGGARDVPARTNKDTLRAGDVSRSADSSLALEKPLKQSSIHSVKYPIVKPQYGSDITFLGSIALCFDFVLNIH
jgi:hypothetical protein